MTPEEKQAELASLRRAHGFLWKARNALTNPDGEDTAIQVDVRRALARVFAVIDPHLFAND